MKDDYFKKVEWSEEDQCYIGSIPGFIGQCCHGDNKEEVYKQLCVILEEWIEINRQEHKNTLLMDYHESIEKTQMNADKHWAYYHLKNYYDMNIMVSRRLSSFMFWYVLDGGYPYFCLECFEDAYE